jgi:hypothetical protein
MMNVLYLYRDGVTQNNVDESEPDRVVFCGRRAFGVDAFL